jgi:hypothetical protein
VSEGLSVAITFSAISINLIEEGDAVVAFNGQQDFVGSKVADLWKALSKIIILL